MHTDRSQSTRVGIKLLNNMHWCLCECCSYKQ